MLLKRLAEYSERVSTGLDGLPPLYVRTQVRYVVELNSQGQLQSSRLTDTADPSIREMRRGVPRPAPAVQRSSGIRPLLLCDGPDYTLGYVHPNGKPDRIADAHNAYMALLARCATATEEPAVKAVLHFLEGDPLGALEFEEGFDSGALMTFRVGQVFPIDLPAVQAFWAEVNDPASAETPTVMQCIVCGQEKPVLSRMPGKIKGVPGGQTSGTAIISANAEAFESYGLEASLVAPTCLACSERFTRGINTLLADKGSRVITGGAAFLFWTREDVGLPWANFLDRPDPKEVSELLNSVYSGRPSPVDEVPFYGTVVSGSGGRVVVRDWMDTTVGEIKQRLKAWFDRQHIVTPAGEERRYFSVFQLAAATVRVPRDLRPATTRSMVRAAIRGDMLPRDLLYGAVQRARVEQSVPHNRAALIKLCLLGLDETDQQEDYMVGLDSENPSTAYHCGRLLAVLDNIQRLAIPGVKAGIVDRFYGSASSAPFAAFDRLVKGAQPHLAKLDRDRHGAYVALQRRLEEIMSRIPASGFPRALTLEDQGRFSLGYYHQRAFDRAQAIARRQAGSDPAHDDLDEER